MKIEDLGTIAYSATDISGVVVPAKAIKTQYGVEVLWKDPKAAGVREGDEPFIGWFDHKKQADSFYLSNHAPIDLKDGELIYADPPELKHEVAACNRYTREAIEIYGERKPA